MGLDPTAPAMTLLLVMLHTGTMFAVIVYFRNDWHKACFSSLQGAVRNGALLIYATAATGIVGLGLQEASRLPVAHNAPDFEIEHLFGNACLMAAALAVQLAGKRTLVFLRCLLPGCLAGSALDRLMCSRAFPRPCRILHDCGSALQARRSSALRRRILPVPHPLQCNETTGTGVPFVRRM